MDGKGAAVTDIIHPSTKLGFEEQIRDSGQQEFPHICAAPGSKQMRSRPECVLKSPLHSVAQLRMLTGNMWLNRNRA